MTFYHRHIRPRVVAALFGAAPISRLRKRIVPLAEGVVVEIGFGAGRNLPYYDRARVRNLHIVTLAEGVADRDRIARDGTGLDIEVVEAPSGMLPLADHMADTVVVTYGFCSAPDAETAMREVRRVLKPGGRLLVVEFGRARSPRIASLQDRLNPLWRPFTCGCNLNRDIIRMLRGAGFDIEAVERVYLRGVPRFIGAHHLGVARPV